MIRNEKARINKRRVGDFVYKVDLDGYVYNEHDLETMSSAYFYSQQEAAMYAKKHRNDEGVYAAYVYRADGDDVVSYGTTWEYIVMLGSYELMYAEFSDAYFESED